MFYLSLNSKKPWGKGKKGRGKVSEVSSGWESWGCSGWEGEFVWRPRSTCQDLKGIRGRGRGNVGEELDKGNGLN